MKQYFGIVLLIIIGFGCQKQNTDEVSTDATAANPDWTETSHSNDAEPDYAIVFPQEKVNTIEITLGKAIWEKIKTDMVAKGKGTFGDGGNAGGGGNPAGGPGGNPGGGGPGGNAGGVPDFGDEPEYFESTIKFNGKTWNNVGFRLKGNSTLSSTWKSGVYKLPFRLKFDEFEDQYPEIKNQRLYGFKDLSFSAAVKDNSLIREKVTADIFRMAGIPAAQTAFYKIYIYFTHQKVFII
mgnify:CR=1 FL=1